MVRVRVRARIRVCMGVLTEALGVVFVSGRIGLLGREGGFGNGYGFMVWSGMRAFFYSLVSLLIASRRSGYLVIGGRR